MDGAELRPPSTLCFTGNAARGSDTQGPAGRPSPPVQPHVCSQDVTGSPRDERVGVSPIPCELPTASTEGEGAAAPAWLASHLRRCPAGLLPCWPHVALRSVALVAVGWGSRRGDGQLRGVAADGAGHGKGSLRSRKVSPVVTQLWRVPFPSSLVTGTRGDGTGLGHAWGHTWGLRCLGVTADTSAAVSQPRTESHPA